MILGTCNFGFDYNGPQVPKKEVFKIIEEFQKSGGGIIDTASNYRESQTIINEYVKVNGQENLRIQSKVYDYDYDFNIIAEELKDCKIYSILYRNPFNQKTIEYLKALKNAGLIEKYGLSIYYPHELRQEANIIQIPANALFNDYLKTMILYSDVQIRSIYKLNIIEDDYNSDFLKDVLKKINFLPKKIDYVIGVDNVNQLKEDMELFG